MHQQLYAYVTALEHQLKEAGSANPHIVSDTTSETELLGVAGFGERPRELVPSDLLPSLLEDGHDP